MHLVLIFPCVRYIINIAFYINLFCRTWRKNTNKMQQYKWFIFNSTCWLLTTASTCFGHLYAHHQEKRPRVTTYGFFAGSVECGRLRCCGATLQSVSTVKVAARAVTFTVLTPYNVAPQHRKRPHPTLAAKNPCVVTRGLFFWWWA